MRISDWSSDVCSSDLRCVERLVDRKLAGQPVFELRPEVDLVGEALVVDDDEQVEVRAIPFGGMRLVDPAAAGIAAVEDDLVAPALFLPAHRRQRDRIPEFFEDDRIYALKLALLACRKMIESCTNRSFLLWSQSRPMANKDG